MRSRTSPAPRAGSATRCAPSSSPAWALRPRCRPRARLPSSAPAEPLDRRARGGGPMDLAEIIIGGGTLAVALVAQGIAVTTTIVKIRRADQARAEERQQQLEQKLEDKSREL